MKDVPNRCCEFRSCLAYYDGDKVQFFESKSPGIIAENIRGCDNENKWSDLWYIFTPDKFTRTLAEFDEHDIEIYNKTKEDSCIIKFGTWYEAQ